MLHLSRRKALLLLGGSALAIALPGRHARAQSGALTLGIQTNVWGAVGMVAEAEKLFPKAGINVTVQKFDSGRAVRDAMVAGRVDIGTLGAAPFVVGAGKGGLSALGTVAYAGGTLAIVASRKSGIKSMAELKGKKIASQLGSETDHVFQNVIAPSFGLNKGDVQIINVKFPDHVSAMAGGSVDAFAGVEPFSSVAEVEGIGTILTDYSKFDIVPLMIAVQRSLIDTRPNDLVAFLRGWLLAVRMFKEEPKRVSSIVWNYYKSQGYNTPEEVISRAIARMDVTPYFRPELPAYLTGVAQTLVKQGQLQAVPDWSKVLDQQLIKRAA